MAGYISRSSILGEVYLCSYNRGTGESSNTVIPVLFKISEQKYDSGAAIAAGMGFGIGEAWLLAHLYAGNPVFNSYQWYEYTGFISERFTVAIIWVFYWFNNIFHSRKRKFLLGISLAMLSHFALNFLFYCLVPMAYLANNYKANIVDVLVYCVFCFVTCVLIWLGNKPNISLLGKLRKALGKATCPKCNATYDRPILGINLLTKRLEKCPNCKKWVIT